MAAPLLGNDVDFAAATTLEAQFALLAVKLQVLETSQSTSSNTINRVTLTPNYDAKVLSISASLPLVDNAVAQTLVGGVQSYLA